jgi:leader peptidase (prepilin peptidase)/N-methyltransferase
MDIILYILLFCIGTVFGSFFTLAVSRIPIGQDITHERSYCPNCNHKLSFLDMIPILSYIFLGGKCRYCKQKIRIRYLILEVFSGIVFVLFAISIKFSMYNLSVNNMTYLIFGLLYISTLFIIAGIDKEKIRIEKSVLLFGYILTTAYIIYLYIVEQDPNIYRYVIYLFVVLILMLIDIFYLRKKIKDNYPVLSVLMIAFTYELQYAITATMTLLIIAFVLTFSKIKNRKAKSIKTKKNNDIKLPIGFYMCVSNIIVLIVTNVISFYA